MTTVVALRFPFGRYHATPWGRAANEGVAEWPPSPWRLLRSLFATWKWRAPDAPEAVVANILQRLASAPAFLLPPCGQGHGRHYMPEKDYPEARTKILDTFISVDPKADVLIRWDGNMGNPEREALARLLALMPYLGRAESGLQARLLLDLPAGVPQSHWLEPGAVLRAGQQVRVLCPEVPLRIDQLTASTTDVRDRGLTTPEGARWVSYRAPLPAGQGASGETKRLRPEPRRVTAVRFQFDAPALPSTLEAVAYGHVLRRAAVKKVTAIKPAGSATLSGRESPGTDEWRTDNHRHAHYLALDSDGDRLLDSAIVWAPEGFSDDDLAALCAVRRLSGEPGFRSVRLVAVGMGHIREVAPELGLVDDREKSWHSLTPFAPYRHRKRESLEDFLQVEVSRELALRGLPEARVRVTAGEWLSFRRRRRLRDKDLQAYGLELLFDNPVKDRPVVLGALSHFGLGVFAAGPAQ